MLGRMCKLQHHGQQLGTVCLKEFTSLSVNITQIGELRLQEIAILEKRKRLEKNCSTALHMKTLIFNSIKTIPRLLSIPLKYLRHSTERPGGSTQRSKLENFHKLQSEQNSSGVQDRSGSFRIRTCSRLCFQLFGFETAFSDQIIK